MSRNVTEPALIPQQERSQRTREKLLEALEALLQERFFEQITIQDLADEAGVAVGTVYRRFRNKEALLPVLYRRLDERLDAWAASVWRGYAAPPEDAPDGGLRAALGRLVSAHVRFYRANAPVLRTLYLQVRLDGELIEPERGLRRKRLYGTLLAPVWACFERSGRPPPSPSRARCFVLLLLSPLTERCLFPENSPASTLSMSDRRFVTELSDALYRYLAGDRAAA
jgi:AcrR family transcriptional regulator